MSLEILFFAVVLLPCSVTVESWACTVPVTFVPFPCWTCCFTCPRVQWVCLGLQLTVIDTVHQHAGQEGVISIFSLIPLRSWPFLMGLGANRMDCKTRRPSSCEFSSGNIAAHLAASLGQGIQSLLSGVCTFESWLESK